MKLTFQLIITFINILTTHTLLTRRKSYVYCFVVFILNTVFFVGALSLTKKYITDPTTLKYVLYFLAFLNIVYIYLIFKESISKKIFTMFSIWMFSTGAMLFSTSLVHFFPENFDKLYIQNLQYITRICLQILLLIISYYWLSTPYRRILALVSDKTINQMSLYPVVAFILLISIFVKPFGYFRTFESVFDTLFFLAFVCLGYFLVFAGISSASKTISLQYNYKIIENQVELQRQNYKTLHKSLSQSYAFKHDIRHHISAIGSMIQQHKYKNALEYIEQFNQNQLSKTLSNLCNNFVADSIIKYYISIAITKNIELKTNLNIPDDIGINSLDLCVVLGNCLENAIEACDKLSSGAKKHIELTSKIIGTHVIFVSTNSFDGKILEIDHVIVSSKQEPAHGIGLSSIRETVNKYNGNVDIKYTEDTFEIRIIMCLCSSIINKPTID